MSKVSPKEPELQDFGITPEEYAVYTGSWTHSQGRAVFFGVIVIGLMIAIAVFAATQDLAYALGLGVVSMFPGFIVTAAVAQYMVEAIGWFKKALLLASPAGPKIKLYEEARATHVEAQREAERVRQETKRAQREAERVQEEEERVRQKAETARLKVERIRRRKLEDYWMSLSGTDFERELATVFRGLGYRVKSTPGSGDDGVDLILNRSGKTTVVQCKAHKNPVGPAIARELFGSMLHFKADRAVLACTGGFTSGVEKFVKGKPISLISVSDIAKLGAEVQGKGIKDTPKCTKCARTMVLRRGSFGKFWGCPRYPRCRVTRDATNW